MALQLHSTSYFHLFAIRICRHTHPSPSQGLAWSERSLPTHYFKRRHPVRSRTLRYLLARCAISVPLPVINNTNDGLLFTCQSSKNPKIDEFSSKGATIAAVNYDDPSSLRSALHGVDVVISTFGRVALASQQALAEASKAAGVKLFIPSEFGNSTGNPQEGTLAYKIAFRSELKEIGLPYTLIYNGVLMDTGLTPSVIFTSSIG